LNRSYADATPEDRSEFAPPGCAAIPAGRRRLFAAVTVFLAVALALLLAEAAVRLFDLPPKPLPALHVPTYRLSDNPRLRYEYRPGYSPDDEPYAENHRGFSINADGFRDRHYPQAKPPDTLRIVAIGDSVTAGNGIADVANTYPKRLEEILNRDRADGRRVEVLNLGVGGYEPLQEAELLRVKGIGYDPDLAIILLCANDLSWNADGEVYARLVARMDDAQRDFAARMARRGGDLQRRLLSKSRLPFFLYCRLRVRGGASPGANAPPADLEGNPLEKAFPLLDRIRRQHDLDVRVFVLPAFDRPFSDYAHQETFHDEVARVAAAHPEVPAIDLLEDFRRLNEPAGTFAQPDGLHPNEHGHNALARIIAQRLGPPWRDAPTAPEKNIP